MESPRGFWDELAPHHAALEDNFFDIRSARAILAEVESPALVVGAGQGLIVEELVKGGAACDGVDSSAEMIRYAKARRGLTLVNADAQALPFADESYRTIIYATGVIDFTDDEAAIGRMLKDGRRVAQESGRIYAGFYRVSEAIEQFLIRVRLLENGRLNQRGSLETYLLSPTEMVRWVKTQAGIGTWTAMAMVLRLALATTLREKTNTARMQKLFRNREVANRLIETAPRYQPYRNEGEIARLFGRLGIPVKRMRTTESCFIVEI